MTRFETIVAFAIIAGLAAVNSPAFAQRVVIGDDLPKAEKGKKSPPRPTRPVKPEEPPKPEEPTFTVASPRFEATKEKAKESAIEAAVERVHEYLLQQEPPVTRMPTIELVRKMVIKHPKASESDPEFGVVTPQSIELPGGTKEERYQVEIAIKVRPEHVRELRSKDRSSEALWVLAGLAGLAAVVAGFFRIDAWTKGYLTSWLMLAAVGTACLLGGLWWWAK